MRTLGILAAVFVSSSSAFAADCPTPYTIDDLLADLKVVEVGLRDTDDAGAAEGGARLAAGLGCLDEVLPPLISARSYRAVGAGYFAANDLENADKWFLTSLEIDPTWQYGIQDIPDGHGMRPHFDAIRNLPAVEPVLLQNKMFAEGEYYLNGRKITKPSARPDRYHVFQAETATLSTSVIVGNQFPATVLEEAPEEAGPVANAKKPKKPKKPNKVKTPKDKTASSGGEGPKEKPAKSPKVKKTKMKTKIVTLPDGTTTEVGVRETPKEKFPLLIGGSAIVAGSGVLYYMAARTSSSMKGIKSVRSEGHMATLNAGIPLPPDGTAFEFCVDGEAPGTDGCFADPSKEVDSLRQKANNLVLASLSMLAVGVGVTTWGVLVDGDMVMPTVNVRF